MRSPNQGPDHLIITRTVYFIMTKNLTKVVGKIEKNFENAKEAVLKHFIRFFLGFL